jgi:Zn-dependent peptidase ImmA (M78 family)
MPTVDVKPELIRWAIDRSGLPADDLLNKFPELDGWRTGKQQPKFRRLEDFAKVTRTPFGYFFLDKPPEEKLPVRDFRTIGDRPIRRPSPELIETIQTMQRRQAWMHDLMIEEERDPLAFVGSGKHISDFKLLAERVRKALHLKPDWAESCKTWEDALRNLRQTIEAAGVLVFSNSVVGQNNYRRLDPEEFRGFVLCDTHAPVIFVNSADSKSAQIFTLAHELVHVFVGSDGLFNLVRMMPSRDDTEQVCNGAAAEFLVPGDKVVERWDEARQTKRPFHTIGDWFKVSAVVAARRALDLRLIKLPEFYRFYEKERVEWQRKSAAGKKESKGDFYRTQDVRLGRRFASEVIRAVREDRILYREAYRLTDLRGGTFSRYCDKVLERITHERQ